MRDAFSILAPGLTSGFLGVHECPSWHFPILSHLSPLQGRFDSNIIPSFSYFRAVTVTLHPESFPIYNVTCILSNFAVLHSLDKDGLLILETNQGRFKCNFLGYRRKKHKQHLKFLEQLPLAEQYHTVNISSAWFEPKHFIDYHLVYQDLFI